MPVGGPLRVEDERSPRPLTGRFLAAAEAAGVPRIADYNGPEQDGCSPVQVTQRNGRRWSANDAYLKPARKRPNLTVVTGRLVERLLFEGDRAVGVLAGGSDHRATREVIVSAGAIGSPQLLLLSGIGPAEHLREVGVDARVELPVGENLQDHPYLVAVWAAEEGSLYGAEKPRALLEWVLRRTGPLTSTVAEAFAFVRSRPGLPAADLQFHFAPAYFVDNGFDEYDGHAITLGPVLVSPRARGHVRLRSASPLDKPRILTNTLAEPEDLAALVRGLELAREWARTEPLAGALGREIHPGPGVELEDYARRSVQLLYHPVGTCAIGTVLDPQLRVRGVDGLRVVDASAFPLIPGGNTNAPTIALAERAADLIRER